MGGNYLARQIGVRAELRCDVVRRGGVEIGTRIEAHVALANASHAPRARRLHRLAARQHCNTRTQSCLTTGAIGIDIYLLTIVILDRHEGFVIVSM